MILPTKHLRIQRSLLGIGGEILLLLDEPKTVSRLWTDFRDQRAKRKQHAVGFDRFVLSLDFLFLIDAVSFQRERIARGGAS